MLFFFAQHTSSLCMRYYTRTAVRSDWILIKSRLYMCHCAMQGQQAASRADWTTCMLGCFWPPAASKRKDCMFYTRADVIFRTFGARAGLYINIVSNRDMRLSFITVMWCVFVNLSNCSCCSFIYLYPLIRITEDYLSINVTGSLFCEITNSHPYNTVSVWRHLVKILWYLLILSP